ncbi:MAG: ribosomal protein L7/L12 [Gammaproteobacteria bacterium]|nr:ribosomal protein L7/L12 [Gammaproteobacteria bacterium]
MSAEVIVTENELPPEVLDAIREGRKIEAIKILREAKGLGLANAKVLVDRASQTHGPKKAIPNFADQRQWWGQFTSLLIALLVVFIAYYFYTGS